jgi:hypothetical protein
MKIKIEKQILIICIISLLLVIGFSGCLESSTNEKSDKSLFIGAWSALEPEDQVYNTTWTFYENNTIKVTFDLQGQPFAYWGTYTIEDGKLQLTSPEATPPAASYDYVFFNGSNRLSISDGNKEIIFEKYTGGSGDHGTLNNNPVAMIDAITVDENSVNNEINVLANDIDSDSNELNISSVGTPRHGSITFTSKYIYYTPENNFYGDDQFDYTISDGHGGTDNATVYVVTVKKEVSEPATGVTMNIKEYIDDQVEDFDWSTYYNRLQKTLDDGDTLNIQDNISVIRYISEDDTTNITFCHQEGYTSYCDSFYFEGNITNQYKEGDEIRITVHIKHVTFSGTSYNYYLEIFEEQWESVSYFNSHVDHFTDYQNGLKPMSPSIIT